MNDITADILGVIKNKMPADRPVPALTDRLKDLDIDSLSVVELLFDLEEKFDIQIPFNANASQAEFGTVGEVVNIIKKLVDEKA
jgi:acyl carrier protein